MINTQEISVKTERVKSVTCDCCGNTFNTSGDNYQDLIELDEMLHLHSHTNEYGSVFGQNALIECDLCQHCVKDLLGPYIRVESQYESGLEA